MPEPLLARCQQKAKETTPKNVLDEFVLTESELDNLIADVLKEVSEELEGLVKINNLLDTEEEQDLIDAEEEFVTYYNQALTDAQNLLIGER